MGGAVHPLPQYAFMAWCSVRRSTGTTLILSSLLPLGLQSFLFLSNFHISILHKLLISPIRAMHPTHPVFFHITVFDSKWENGNY
jgi:hypothetical protein